MQRDFVAGGEAARHGFIADARVTQFLFGIVGIHPEDVERHLPVDGNRLNTLDDGGPGAFEHSKRQLTSFCRAIMGQGYFSLLERSWS